MCEFSLVATGGTFDILHKGHRALLEAAFLNSKKVIIGLTSDEMAQKKGKSLHNKYEERLANLLDEISLWFPGFDFRIQRLDDDFGPAVFGKDMEALVVSRETHRQGKRLNELRAQKGLPPVEIIEISMRRAKDGRRISSTRIRNSEIDREGHLL